MPAGVTVHFYARPGEYAWTPTFLYVLAGAQMKPVRSVTGPVWIDDTSMSPITKAEYDWSKALADINGLEYYAGGHEGAPLALCTKPYDDVGEPFFGPADDACTVSEHTCDGYLARAPKGTEIHVSSCQAKTAMLSEAARRILSWFPQNKRLESLARTLFAEPDATPAIMRVGGEEVAYHDVKDMEHDLFEDHEEVSRFLQLAVVDKHVAWQKFLAYPTAVRYQLMYYSDFREAVESAQKAVVRPEGGAWVRLDELARLKGVDTEDLITELHLSGELPLAPSFDGFRAAMSAECGAAAQPQDSHAAESWLGIFRHWLHTPAGMAASGAEGQVAVGLVTWLAGAEMEDALFGEWHERMRFFLDFSELLQDARHPVAVLFPEYAEALKVALESYVEREQWLVETKLCEGLTRFDDVREGQRTVMKLMHQLEDHQAQLDEQLAGTDPESFLDVDAVHEEMTALGIRREEAQFTLNVLEEMDSYRDMARESYKNVSYEAVEMMEAPYAVFREARCGWEDLVLP